jgi:basic amino acid/polyamine antiporter, APA family
VAVQQQVSKQLDRKLGFLSVFSIAVGAMLGSGIFVLPGLAAAIAGPWVSLSYLLAGLLVMPAVMSKAELATAMPVAGGSFVYVDRSMGPWMGTVTGIGTWFALSAKTAFALVGLGAYLVLFTDLPTLPVSMGILLLLLMVNLLGAGKVSGLQVAVVGLTLAALMVFVVMAVPEVQPERFEPAFPHGFAGIVAGAGFVFVSYNGVTKICSVAEEVQRPERNIPLGMLAAQLTVMALYALIAWLISGTVPAETLATDITPVATAATLSLGKTAGTVLAIVAIVGLISMCNAGILASSRFPFAMGRASIMPRVFEKVSARFGTPHLALALTGVLLIALVAFLPVQKLAKLASGFTIFIFCVENIAVMVLRETGPRWYKPTFRSPLYPWTQILGTIGGIWLIVQLGQIAVVSVVGGFVIGTAWYMGYARKRVTRKGAIQHILGESRTLRSTELAETADAQADDRARVIVPVFGGEPAPERLIRLASSFVDEGVLDVIRYEEVAEQAALASFLEEDEAMEQLAKETAHIGEEVKVGVEFHDVVTHNAKNALHRHALASSTEWIVMAWPKPAELSTIVRHPMTWWQENPPCDQAIFLDRGGPHDGDTSDDYPRILVLAEPGPYDSMLIHIADRVAMSQTGGCITLLDTVKPDVSEGRLAETKAYHEQLAGLCLSPVTSRIETGTDSHKIIREVSGEYDLLVIGAAPERGFLTVFFGSREHQVAENATCSVLKLKAPRHRVHHRLSFKDEETEEVLRFGPFIQDAELYQLKGPLRKEDLFKHADEALAEKLGVPAGKLGAALEGREKVQSTALAEGVAISAPGIRGIKHPMISILRVDRTLDWGARDGVQIDVLVLVLASPAHRRTQLLLLDALTRMVHHGRLLGGLRAARTPEDMREVLAQSAETIGEVVATDD